MFYLLLYLLMFCSEFGLQTVATDSRVLVEDILLQNVVERIQHRRPANNALQHVKTDATCFSLKLHVYSTDTL